MNLSSKFDQALQYAAAIHREQIRKGTEIPYLAHLLGVASIALEHGASEDEAIGALLHDAAEDAGGLARIEDIRRNFGDAVAAIVEGCTDSVVVPKPPWRKRKEDYIAHLPSASPSVRLVSASDKLHNARAIPATIGSTARRYGPASPAGEREPCGITGRSSKLSPRRIKTRSPKNWTAWFPKSSA